MRERGRAVRVATAVLTTGGLLVPVLITGPAAEAQSRTIRDAVGDQAGKNRHIDIRRVKIAHRKRIIKVNIVGRAGKAGFTRRGVRFAYVKVRAGKGRYFATASPRGRRVVTYVKRGGPPRVRQCKKLNVRFRYKKSRITFRIPRRCVGKPRKLRGEIQVQGNTTGRQYDKVRWKKPIRRG